MTTDSIHNADHRLTAGAAYGVASRLRGQSGDLLSQTRHPGSTLAASGVAGSVAETVRAFEQTLRELAFRIPDAEAAARLDMAAGLLAAGRSLTEDASALLTDTGLGSSELAELRAAGLAREAPELEPVPQAAGDPVTQETLDRYTRGLPPRNPGEQVLISRLAAYDFLHAWEQARVDHLTWPTDDDSGLCACQPGTCPVTGPFPPAGPAAAAAARNLADRMREDHFAHGTVNQEPGPHYGPACHEGSCPWDSAILPPGERAARALAREHIIGVTILSPAVLRPGTVSGASFDFPVELTRLTPIQGRATSIPPAGKRPQTAKSARSQ
jgi:hypothetical protein